MSTKVTNDPFAITFMPGMSGGFKMMKAAVNTQAQAMKALLNYQAATLGFIKHRYEQEMQLIDDLVEAEELNDAFDVMSDFLGNTADEYAREVGKLAEMGSSFAADAAKSVTKEAEEAFSDAVASTAAA